MSSRAIRKLQKLREQQQQHAASQDEDDSDNANDDVVDRAPKPKFNAFDLLNAANDDEEDQDQGEEEQEDDGAHGQAPAETARHLSTSTSPPLSAAETGTRKSKKKKSKAKKKRITVSEQLDSRPSHDADLDEIDRALKELGAEPKGLQTPLQSTIPSLDASYPKTPEELLAIEPKFLNATNEMRKLFGNVVLENFDAPPSGGGGGRRRERDQEMLDLGRALTGRYSPASRGQSLAGVTQRRNILMQGKDEWPRAPSGGLGMEVIEKLSDGTTIYRILHNAAYQDTQRQFDMCVESMDPQRLIHLLQYNPYHISTLLQVSDIAKHQGDHAVSADLLERALFNIGRSAHSSFGNRLKDGHARLDFVHLENRELWLVGWRYIANLGMKGTWRTAYEWAKLLLSLDVADPYFIKLLIDHLALRGREYSHFVDLCTKTRFCREWDQYPNIQCSLALAYLRLGKPKECRIQLRRAMSRYPWIFCKLAQELDIKPIPKQIWGKMPPTESHELLSELYIARAKDLWNTPEATALMFEVADTLSDEEERIEPPEITLDMARHVILSDIPRVTTHLPSRFISPRISASDPLPPYDSEAYRRQSNPAPAYGSQLADRDRAGGLRDLLQQMNNGLFPQFWRAGQEPRDEESVEEDDDAVADDDGTGRNRATEVSYPSADQQPLLEQWLLGEGLQILRSFFQQHGIDRGNWMDAEDISPLDSYVHALRNVHPDASRQHLLHGPIREAMGDLLVDMLEDELGMMTDDGEDASR